MVTHDVNEAVFLSDRVVVKTADPETEVGNILTIPFPRPRVRSEVMSDPCYLEIRNHLLDFLNERWHIRPNRIAALHTMAATTVEDCATLQGALRT